jgi:hypothetical protein
MSTDAKFEETVRNLLRMKPKPHDGASALSKSQSVDDQSSSKRETKLRKSVEP